MPKHILLKSKSKSIFNLSINAFGAHRTSIQSLKTPRIQPSPEPERVIKVFGGELGWRELLLERPDCQGFGQNTELSK